MPEMSGSSPFVMIGARVLSSGATHLEQQVVALEEAVGRNPDLTFDLSKTLIESACKTIHADRGQEVDSAWDLPRLLKETLKHLQLVPDDTEKAAETSGSIKKTIGGLHTVIQGVCELRNLQGFASHGKDAYHRPLEVIQAQLVARAADVVVNFLFRIHRRFPNTDPARRLVYAELAGFNDWVDEANEAVRIFTYEYKPSEVLYQVDDQAYRDLMMLYDAEQEVATQNDPLKAAP
jgi:hypothetical protein